MDWEFERIELYRELFEQWKYNHWEHCGGKTPPYPHDGECYWLMPTLLASWVVDNK